MKLKQIIAEMGEVDAENLPDRDISGIAYDSRRVTPGMIFVAISGRNVDGHEYISRAISQGAAAVICQNEAAPNARTDIIRVADTRVALARTAAAFYAHPSDQLDVVGVTGTNGKTTVSFMTKHILESAGVSTGLLGTVRYEIGERTIPAQRTTPEALEIQQMMRQMLRSGCQACVMEASSHGLEQNRVDQVEFNVGVFTNLSPEHLDYHGDLESYFAAKRKLMESLRHGKKAGVAVVNIDDPHGARIVRELQDLPFVTYGRAPKANLQLKRVTVAADATLFECGVRGDTLRCRLPLIGRYNANNALAAIGAAMALGVPAPDAAKALESMPGVPGRLETVEAGQDFKVYVDYAHTDDALANALETVREVTSGRVLVLFGCGGDRDAGKRRRMGGVAALQADFTVITSDNPRSEPPEQIANEIVDGHTAHCTEGLMVELDRARAIEEIIWMARPGDAVVIAGKGHETYQEFENTVVPFDDRVHAREALEAMENRMGS